MKTFISVHHLRNLIRQYDNEEITLSRFAEIINQDVNKALHLPNVGHSVCAICDGSGRVPKNGITGTIKCDCRK